MLINKQNLIVDNIFNIWTLLGALRGKVLVKLETLIDCLQTCKSVTTDILKAIANIAMS